MINPRQASGVYSIINRINSLAYIGQTLVTFDKRWCEHRSKLSRGRHNNLELQRDWLGLGESAFEFVIIRAFNPKLGSKLRMPLIELERSIVQTSTLWLYNSPRVRYDISQWLIDELESYRLT